MLGFANAIDFAHDMVLQGFNDTVISELNHWNEDQAETRAVVS